MTPTQSIITILVQLYLKLPFKPFEVTLRNSYQKYLESNEKNRTIIKNVNGIRYELDLTEVIDSAIFYDESREPNTSKALSILCKPGHVIFDIGANIGSHTLPISKAVGFKGKVFAFEPVPWALDKLEKNMSLNNFTNITVEAIALSDFPDNNSEFNLRASFKTSSSIPVNSDGLLNDNWWNACEKVKVRVETLDNYIFEKNITRVDLLKIDVDGFELKVLKGALKLLTDMGPVILMELAPSWVAARGDDVRDIVKLLHSLGYQFYDEESFNLIANITNLIFTLKPESGVNVIASKEKINI